MNDGVMIAFLPANAPWVRQDLPHMTLVFCGKMDDHSPADFNTLGKDALSVARIMGSFSLQATDVGELGEGIDRVDVLNLYPTPQLLVARKLVKNWDASGFPEFKPHVTIGPVGSGVGNFPTTVFFEEIAVVWGDKILKFSLFG